MSNPKTKLIDFLGGLPVGSKGSLEKDIASYKIKDEDEIASLLTSYCSSFDLLKMFFEMRYDYTFTKEEGERLERFYNYFTVIRPKQSLSKT